MDVEFAPGDRIGDRYQIVAPLGKGGFARVYRGIQLGMNRPVAIKILAPKLNGIKASDHDAARASFARRFEKEAQVLSTLLDPSTITVHDYGVSEQGAPYMILELVEGVSLEQLGSHELPMSPQRVVTILMRVLESLREAHFLGILHRDIKPSNIMIFSHMGEHEHVKVLDFGMAKIYQGDDLSPETQNGMLLGTPRYMAPELIREPSRAGPYSDLYSLGLVCYEMLTGTRAVSATATVMQVSRQLDDIPITLPDDLDMPPALRLIINKMLDKNIEARWSGAQHVLNALNHDVLPEFARAPAPVQPAPAQKPLFKMPALSFSRPVTVDDPESMEEDDASTITLTEEVVIDAMTASRRLPPPAPLVPATLVPASQAPAPLAPTPLLAPARLAHAPGGSLESTIPDSSDAHASPSGVRLPGRPVFQHSGMLPPPPSHSVARPLRASTTSQQIAIEDRGMRKRMDSAHNVAAPLTPLPLSWDDNEVTPPPMQPDRAERLILLDAPSGRHPTSTSPQRVPVRQDASSSMLGAMPQRTVDDAWLAIQRRNQMLSALLLLVVLGITLYVIVQYLL